MNRKIVIPFIIACSLGAGVGYAQSPTRSTDSDAPAPAPVKKEAVPNDAKKDELSKKLLQRKQELDNQRIKPAETVQPNVRKEAKPADKPKGDKK
jgi:hypothetical protein